jgi:RimJ/RimL family protein N-acetyltransferase
VFDFSSLNCGAITLHLITENNQEEVRALFCSLPDGESLIPEIDGHYLPRYDADGRRTKWGFYSVYDAEVVGLSLLGISSWADLRGYTGADTLPHQRGKGIAPGSKPHLFHLGFALLGLNRIETGCFASNIASRRSIEKTPGFEFEGVLRKFARNAEGKFEDELRYAILRSDWQRYYGHIRVDVAP